MATARITFTPDWAFLQKHYAMGRFESYLRNEVAKATRTLARHIQSQMRKRIRRRDYTRNALLTRLLKRSSTPLVEDGDLIAGINVRQMGWNRAFVGLLRAGKFSGRSFNLAVHLHGGPDGKKPLLIKVTPKMRAMFTFLSLKSHGWADINLTGRALELWNKNPRIKWRALSRDTTHITIPQRPFVKAVFDDPHIHKTARRVWKDAVVRALTAGRRRRASKGTGRPRGPRRRTP